MKFAMKDTPIIIENSIDGQDISWTLGSMLYNVNKRLDYTLENSI